MRALIIDDELLVAKNLQLLLTRYCTNVMVEGIAHTAKEAETLIKNKAPDLIFLDVEMPHGSGFDLLKKFEQINFGVIFVTAFDHYAIQAIKYSAIDYLLKPIDIDELKAAVQKAEVQIKSKSANVGLNLLLENIAQPAPRLHKLTLPAMNGMIVVDIDDILYCKSEGNYTYFYLANTQVLMVTKQIGMYEDLLPEPLFCRVHRQYIINVSKVSKYMKGRGGSVIMSDGKEIDVAARKKEDFLKAYKLG